jgi:uncharacterized membrane protein (Fun14 family)
MIVDPTLTNSIAPFSGSALCGFFIGFALKKILKWLLIGLTVLAGIIFMVIQWMLVNGYIHGSVDWSRIGNDAVSYTQHAVTQLNLNGFHGIAHSLGIPITSGLGIGLAAGLLKG